VAGEDELSHTDMSRAAVWLRKAENNRNQSTFGGEKSPLYSPQGTMRLLPRKIVKNAIPSDSQCRIGRCLAPSDRSSCSRRSESWRGWGERIVLSPPSETGRAVFPRPTLRSVVTQVGLDQPGISFTHALFPCPTKKTLGQGWVLGRRRGLRGGRCKSIRRSRPAAVLPAYLVFTFDHSVRDYRTVNLPRPPRYVIAPSRQTASILGQTSPIGGNLPSRGSPVRHFPPGCPIPAGSPTGLAASSCVAAAHWSFTSDCPPPLLVRTPFCCFGIGPAMSA